MTTEPEMEEVVIPAERAVFWMDRFGRWCNEGGRFRHKKLIDYFNASIRRDRNGYFVEQIRDRVREKVYFHYEDTPLFVVDLVLESPIELLLNTRERITLVPQDLFVRGDDLYLQRGEEQIKFTDRALLKLAGSIEYEDERYAMRIDDRLYPIVEK